MSTQHTPGQWVAHSHSRTHYVATAHPEDPELIADVYPCGTGSASANARLIAAAPELLDVIDEVYQLLYHYDLAQQPYGVNWGPVEMLRQEMIDKLEYALAKAGVK